MTSKNSHLSSNISYSRVIHLSHLIDTDIPKWPGDPTVEFTSVAEIQDDGYYLRGFSLGEHSATHINAPNSFYANGVSIDQYPASSLIVPAIVINICKQAAVDFDYVLTVSDIQTWETQFGQIPAGNLVILYTGWQEKWSNQKAFFNQDIQGKMHFPGFSQEATEFLIIHRQIAGVGIDTHGVDSGQDANFTINRLLLERSLIVIENLTNLDNLPPQGTTLIIGILRLKGGSGSPAAIMALF
ncbi:cyclase family protein [Dolichospermum sp. ST_sed1]|nr:cyclase family protein [Dolichospermum sp. ST_sed1]MDD1424735.1 cyclase family protein [Dolichospermum sp. ST_sed9]MDD1430345.1 cyclase family protein [Dolichospermum sp. ST_sed6]MDD1438836.1 cyclase family protein [Dolichospermum sp. ST_sed3]MDD1444739.1 cyclase family protein [Dolichospermum sp. ST_sed8]MDD1458575.1 cyclase family protein [Dolichospermum sp. ST_sed2]MDD1464278.1 cyclase family protein [Dolichospermum sp. ST_sed5]MDD1470020.1 cyclase family protein [Dolichospermum sp. ST